MDTYNYEVTLQVSVDAFNRTDAEDTINEMFGPGEECGVTIIKSTVKDK